MAVMVKPMNIRADWRSRLTVAAIALFTLLLGGCGPSLHDQQIEQRLAAAEAKAESAERRAKRAEAAAILGNPNATAVVDQALPDPSDEGESSELSAPEGDDNQEEPVGDGLSPIAPDSDPIVENQEPPAPNALG